MNAERLPAFQSRSCCESNARIWASAEVRSVRGVWQAVSKETASPKTAANIKDCTLPRGPGCRKSSARVSPVQQARQRERGPSVSFADTDRRDACPPFSQGDLSVELGTFMLSIHEHEFIAVEQEPAKVREAVLSGVSQEVVHFARGGRVSPRPLAGRVDACLQIRSADFKVFREVLGVTDHERAIP